MRASPSKETSMLSSSSQKIIAFWRTTHSTRAGLELKEREELKQAITELKWSLIIKQIPIFLIDEFKVAYQFNLRISTEGGSHLVLIRVFWIMTWVERSDCWARRYSSRSNLVDWISLERDKKTLLKIKSFLLHQRAFKIVATRAMSYEFRVEVIMVERE